MPTPVTCPDLSQYQRLAAGELQDVGRDVLLRHIGVTDPDGRHKSCGRRGPLRRQFQSGKPGTSMAVIRTGFLIPWPVIQASA